MRWEAEQIQQKLEIEAVALWAEIAGMKHVVYFPGLPWIYALFYGVPRFVIESDCYHTDSHVPTSGAPSPLYTIPHASAMCPPSTNTTPTILEVSDSDNSTDKPLQASPELFWTRKDWTKHVDQLKSVTQKHGAVAPVHLKMGWAVTNDGKPVTITRHEEMCAYAREFWQDWLNKGVGPLKWGDLDLTLASGFRDCMKARFPELKQCAGDWKTLEIGKQYYSAWLSEAGRKAALNASRGRTGMPGSIKDEDEASQISSGSEAEVTEFTGPRK